VFIAHKKENSILKSTTNVKNLL